ncbi:MAG TPA: hypothetical protein DCG85_01425 [Lachnospiraceae bacterium]|nr:hypothetical protein [Lachnospiraceae bacterium]
MTYESRKNRSDLIKILLIAGILIGAFLLYKNRPVTHDAIAGLPDPVQGKMSAVQKLTAGDFNVTMEYVASYHIDALVVHTKDYKGSSLPDLLSPKDLALAWGKVAEYNDRINFNWSQSGRWYSWYVSGKTDLSPIGGLGAITPHSSNNHIIPADDNVKEKLKKVKAGDHVVIDGYLVNIDGKKADGYTYTWHTSRIREDDGNGSCEIIYATNLVVVN